MVALANQHGLALVTRDVFEHPRLAELGRFSETGGSEEYDWESPIAFNATGTRGAAFLVNPPSIATPYVYRDLAIGVAPEHSSFALQPVPAGGSTGYLVSVEEMAEKCLDDLVKVWPEGPYVLGGWSLGGLIAWEAAVRLGSAGNPPRDLLLIDPMDPTAPAGDQDRDGSKVQDLDGWFAEILSVLEGRTQPSLREDQREELAALLDQVSLPHKYLDYPASDLVQILKGIHISLFAEKNYVPPSFDGDVTLVVTEDSMRDHSEQSTNRRVDESVEIAVAGWRARTNGDFRAYVIDATHLSVVFDPSRAGAVAQVINNSFERSDSLSALEGPHSQWLKPLGLGEANG